MSGRGESDSRETAARAVIAAERARVQRRTLTVVVISQVLGGAGLAAGVTVGALLVQDVLGSMSLAGVAAALLTLGSALTAFLVGRVTQRLGRRIGLGLGFAAGGVGAIGVVVAATTALVPILFLSLFVYGAGTATNLQARYAGTDLATPARRGSAISVAMVSTTLGAVAGPNLVEPLGAFATGLGLPALAGPFLLAAVAYLAAGTAFLVLLRPDPFLLARRLDAELAQLEVEQTAAEQVGSKQVSPTTVPRPRPGVGAYVGAAVMVVTQIAMVAVMTMTPVHMRAHHHGLGEVGLVIGIHIAAMYLPSLVTGVLVDRIGRTPMAIAAGVTLLLAGVTGALAPADSLGLLILALALLGLGWNFGLIAGTALVVDHTVPANRARTQGTLDVLIALAGAGAGVMSGVVMAGVGYGALSIAGGVLALLLIPVLLWARRVTPRRALS
ncbi:Sugar phosphate permease [Plantibacter flavus]|uniref:Sugar phosphate permease n=1 Tax=Plantibacter flavus TaxID=150123 RepID=A0A3N2C7H5_9MICO|nr:MFS transporter [Plantibacter flavus]ROR83473.1 sugar phosphate permease [Plantibacter flavus]SMG23791.1 Sugar phosphate permease [Plantibacter flavus]